MAKITILGAGSVGFAKPFISDALTRPALAEGTLTLMDIDEPQLDVMTTIAKKLVKQLGVPTTIEATTDRRRALDGADHVVSVVNGLGDREGARVLERRISEKYGVNQPIGGDTGPGGVFLSLRYFPLMLDICRDMEELCPDAYLLHYSNDTPTVSWALNVASPIKSVGMCHSVQHTAETLARYIGAPPEETGHWAAGVNHMAWMLKFEWGGEDAYPLLREAMEDPETYEKDRVRFEIMRYFDYFPTESSTHHSEYYPYFRKNAELIARFTPGRPGGVGFAEEIPINWKQRREQLRKEAYGEGPAELVKTPEYAIAVIHAMVSNEPTRFNGNVMNTGLITNLPQGSCVEVPCLVDNTGVHPCHVGDLPPQCASLNNGKLAGIALAVRGGLEGDRKAIEQAISLDPLTAAMCTLDQIHDMVEELFEAEAEWLPQFA
jgi:alpha-galactosidase